MKIRYAFVNNIILGVYRMLPEIRFPLDVLSVIDLMPNCRCLTYQKFASISKCTPSDVIGICESKSGCTHYDIKNDRYLILYNESTNYNNNFGRQRWTIGHELGHVMCNHLSGSAYNQLSENSLSETVDREYEAEADYFSATLLSPFPLYSELNITSPICVQDTFGLSDEASLYRYKQYMNWKRSHIKTAWENDMLKNYRSKNIT